MSIKEAEDIIISETSKHLQNGERVLYQPGWNDGWLLHKYDCYGKHITTVGSHDLESAISKLSIFEKL